ncbi:transposase DNA-binding-containing protein, partial [Paraburkholderia humisilvae]
MAAEPRASVPQACHGWGETIAAYRSFNNDKVIGMRFRGRTGNRSKDGCKRIASCFASKTRPGSISTVRSWSGWGPLTYEAQRGCICSDLCRDAAARAVGHPGRPGCGLARRRTDRANGVARREVCVGSKVMGASLGWRLICSRPAWCMWPTRLMYNLFMIQFGIAPKHESSARHRILSGAQDTKDRNLNG